MGKLRLSLCKNFGAGKGTVGSVVVVEATFEAIATAANNKLKLKLKNTQSVRLFLKTRVGAHPAGTELPRDDCSSYLCNDAIISVGVGEAGASATSAEGFALDKSSLPPLRSWPASDDSGEEETLDAAAEDLDAAAESSAVDGGGPSSSAPSYSRLLPRPAVSQELRFCGHFPVLEGDVLPLIREAVAGCAAFTETNHGAYIAFDYSAVRAHTAPPRALEQPVHAAQPHDWAHRHRCAAALLCTRHFARRACAGARWRRRGGALPAARGRAARLARAVDARGAARVPPLVLNMA
jgi:hypothetical protein